MKVGPVHVIRDRTFRRLHDRFGLWDAFRVCLVEAEQRGNFLANSVLARSTGLYHSPLLANFAPGWVPPADALDATSRAAAERVVEAFRRATRDAAEPPSPGMWLTLESQRSEFLQAALRGDIDAVQAPLARLFRTPIPWGLGQICSSHLETFEHYPDGNFVQLGQTDNIVSLAEALGVSRVSHLYQNATDHLRPLDIDIGATIERIVAKLGFDVGMPRVAGQFGTRVGERLVTIDGIVHAYTAHRLRQLGAMPGSTVAEIGGGYGCLALMMHRAGFRDYAVYDLPWVNVLQGYFLIMAGVEVCLYGESGTGVKLLPYWEFDRVEPASLDFVINTDSLPEIGRETAAAYLPKIRRALRGVFLSINQEAKGANAEFGEQNCVAELIDEAGGFATLSRQRYWMRNGYVEEVFRPA